MPKPLLLGDAAFDAERIDELERTQAHWDNSYVPGYGELRRDNELRIAKGQRPIEHDRLQWIRVGRPNGEDVHNNDMLTWHMMGYQFATAKDLSDRGWGMPPTAHVDAGGRIRRDDLALALVPAAIAKRNADRQAAINAEFHNDALTAVPRHLDVIESTSRRIGDLADAND